MTSEKPRQTCAADTLLSRRIFMYVWYRGLGGRAPIDTFRHTDFMRLRACRKLRDGLGRRVCYGLDRSLGQSLIHLNMEMKHIYTDLFIYYMGAC